MKQKTEKQIEAVTEGITLGEQLSESTSNTTTVEDVKTQEHPKLSLLLTLVVWACRILVGGVFAFSGFVKAIDPWGSFYKFNEYILTLGIDWLQPLSLFMAFAVPVIEFVLGVAVLVGAYRRVAPFLVVLFMCIATPLTLWLAATNAVPDCGCFGDAIKLSNWATFWKNVVLLLGAIFLLIKNRKASGLYSPAIQWILIAFTFAFVMSIACYGYFKQPLIDFRPFPEGTQLASTSASTNEADYVFVYEKNGVQQEFEINNLPDENEWSFVDRRPKRTAPRSNAYAKSLSVFDGGDNVSDVLLSSDKLVLFLMPDMSKVSISYTFLINELNDYAIEQGASVAAVTAGTDRDIAWWRDISMAHYPVFTADDSEIKMIARGNPAVVYVENQQIMWKRTLGSIKSERLHDMALSLKTLCNDYDSTQVLDNLVKWYLIAILVLLVFNRLCTLMAWSWGRGKAKATESAAVTDGKVSLSTSTADEEQEK